MTQAQTQKRTQIQRTCSDNDSTRLCLDPKAPLNNTIQVHSITMGIGWWWQWGGGLRKLQLMRDDMPPPPHWILDDTHPPLPKQQWFVSCYCCSFIDDDPSPKTEAGLRRCNASAHPQLCQGWRSPGQDVIITLVLIPSITVTVTMKDGKILPRAGSFILFTQIHVSRL